MKLWSHTENRAVDPEDVLDPDELCDYHGHRAEDHRTGRRHVARYWPGEESGQAAYERSVYGDE